MPTDEEKAAAKAKAEQALADLKAGKDWDGVAKAVSTDTTKDQAGDLSYIDKDAALDTAFRDALIAAPKDTPTDVIEGADGVYRIGRVSEIIPPAGRRHVRVADQRLPSGALPQVNEADLRAAIRHDVVRQKLGDAILAPYLAAGPQRDVSEIYMQEGSSESGPGAIKVRHILYSPNGDPQTASNVKPDDPAWAAAKAKADATYAKLQANPSLFDSIARAESDEGLAKTSGGKLPYFSTDDAVDPSFMAAIEKPGLQPGQLLEPVKSAFGWHVIQVMHGPTDADWAAKLKADIDSGKLSFADAARDNSDKYDPTTGGSIGWVTKGQLDRGRREGDLRGADRQGQRPAQGRRRRDLPVPRGQGGDADAGRGPEADAREHGRSATGTPSRRRTTRSPGKRPLPKPRADPVGGGPPMLDALLAEARLRWGLDPAAGLAVVVAERVIATPIEPTVPTLVVPAARLKVADGGEAPRPLPGRHGSRGGDAVEILRRLYPADHPVGRFGAPEGTTVGALTAGRPRRRRSTSRPSRPSANAASPWGMPWISDRLRAPDGCPWDREQTHESLRNHLLEEAYEVYDALGAGATPELAGELGDLLLQVVLHAQLAAEEGVFDMTDVWSAIATKIVRRHPHVFGEAEARTASDVNRQWERIKQGERAAAAGDGTRAARAARSTGSAGRCPRWRRARRCRSARRTWATTGRRSTACWTRSARRWASSSRPRTPPSGPRSWATCCSCSSTSVARPTSRSRRRSAPPTTSSAGGSGTWSSPRRPVARPCAT